MRWLRSQLDFIILAAGAIIAERLWATASVDVGPADCGTGPERPVASAWLQVPFLGAVVRTQRADERV